MGIFPRELTGDTKWVSIWPWSSWMSVTARVSPSSKPSASTAMTCPGLYANPWCVSVMMGMVGSGSTCCSEVGSCSGVISCAGTLSLSKTVVEIVGASSSASDSTVVADCPRVSPSLCDSRLAATGEQAVIPRIRTRMGTRICRFMTAPFESCLKQKAP